MSALDKARAWLRGEIDTDPMQLVRELLAASQQGEPAGYDRELIAQMLEDYAYFDQANSRGVYKAESVREQARLLRAALSEQPASPPPQQAADRAQDGGAEPTVLPNDARWLLESIVQYGSDTLREGTSDRAFYVAGVREMRRRARLALDALATQPQQAEEESRANTALKVTLFGVECYLPSSIAKSVQAAVECMAMVPVGEVRWAAGIENSISEVYFGGLIPPIGTMLYAAAPKAVKGCRCTGLMVHAEGAPGYPCAAAPKAAQGEG